MEALTDVPALLRQGDDLLIHGRTQEATADFALAAQQAPQSAEAHLGLAEASLARGDTQGVGVESQRVLQLAPSSADAAVAQALLDVASHRYDVAISELDRANSLDPGRAYIHALRGYCYRRLGNSYDAALAEARAARLSGVRDWGAVFPPPPAPPAFTPPGAPIYGPYGPQGMNQPAPTYGPSDGQYGQYGPYGQPGQNAPWTTPAPQRRARPQAQLILTGAPVVTYALIALNVVAFLVELAAPGIVQAGSDNGSAIVRDPAQAYRLLTSMFLHASILHIAVNMLSLYFVGSITERLFGSGRFAFIYLASGLIGGLAQAIAAPNAPAVGASGAIFGIFGAFGAFFLLQRRSLGPVATSALNQWVFYLIINAAITFFAPNIGILAHVGGLVSGFALGALLVNAVARRRIRRL